MATGIRYQGAAEEEIEMDGGTRKGVSWWCMFKPAECLRNQSSTKAGLAQIWAQNLPRVTLRDGWGSGCIHQ